MLQRDPVTQRGSDSYLGVDTLLRRGVHDHATLEDTCTQRRQQRGTDFRACTLRKARCHPAHGITVIGGCSIAGAETCQQSLRGAVLVSSTYGRDILAGVAMRRHREARNSHLDSPDTVLLSAHRSEQHLRLSKRKGVLTELLETVPGSHLDSHHILNIHILNFAHLNLNFGF